METIAERITKIVEMSGMKKTDFATAINVTPSYISKLAKNKDVNPSRLVIDAICKKEGVSKEWLETGAGPIYTPERQSGGFTKEELASRFSDMINKPIPYRNEIIWCLSSLSPTEWKIIGEKIVEMADIVKQAKAEVDDVTPEDRSEENGNLAE